MQEETRELLEQQLLQSVEKVREWILEAESLATREVPKVAEEIIKWEVAGNLLTAGTVVALVLAMLALWWWPWRKWAKARQAKYVRSDAEDIWTFGGAFIVGASICLAIPAAFHLGHALRAIVAPRVVILEYVQKFIH